MASRCTSVMPASSASRAARFLAFATATADYVAHLQLVIDGLETELPAAPAPIA